MGVCYDKYDIKVQVEDGNIVVVKAEGGNEEAHGKDKASVFHDIYRKEHNNGNEWRQENSPVRTYLVLSSSLPQ
ncbi:hypothetical protein RJ639_018591 [Escallonia herrerae]|uniref:Uncharacterized protein n=1 Tax=Escallonia herrerae TaxID=1293975 RepID=A0AA89AI90_9ASTE|nr:hypothetical protein RJ639_018591 [Escallonia herrerae]